MNIYKESTQNKNWIFNENSLIQMQALKFQRGLQILDELKKTNETHKVRLQSIKPEEEKNLIIYYTNQILKIISKKSQSKSLKSYALSFFRRFYLKKTIIDYDPEYLLCAAIFLGFKIAQLNINLDIMKNICPFLNVPNEDKNVDNIKLLFEYEFYLINVLNYDFYVFSPYKAIIGFIYEIQKSEYLTQIESIISIKDIEVKLEYYIDLTYLTDIIFIYSYSIITLSCLYITFEIYGIDTDIILKIFSLKEVMNYEKFSSISLPAVKESLNNIKILSDQEFIDRKKKILLFLKHNPKYTEKLEKDRNGLKIKMNTFSDMFEDVININESSNSKNKNEFLLNKRDRD